MKESQLIRVLLSFNLQEWKALSKYIQSPFFNQRQDVIHLFTVLYQHFKKQNNFDLEEKVVFKKVFHADFDNIKFNHCKSQLLQLIYDFLAFQEQENEPFRKEVMLSRSLRKHQLFDLFNKRWKRAQVKFEKSPFRNADYFQHLHLLQLEKGNYDRQIKHSVDIGLQGIADSFSIQLIARVLRHGCALLSQQFIKTKAVNFPILPLIIDLLNQGHYADVPVIQVYFISYKALNEETSTKNFASLRTSLQEKAHLFPIEEIRDLYLLAINYCIKKLNQGEQVFIREAFDLYRSALENNILFENGTLSPFTYNNILVLGLNLKEFKWTENFLYDYKKRLPEKDQENTFQYNLAIFYFRKPDYDKALDLLQQVKFKEVLYNLDARRMLLRIYYEQKEWDALHSLFDSFRTYLYRKRNIGYHKANYLNLVKIVKKMISNDLNNKLYKSKLRKEVELTRALAEREWLLEQLK